MTEEDKDGMVSKQWVFPPRRCPRCKQFNSVATHTDSVRGVQYRRCRTPLCQATRVRFSVKGVPSEPPEPQTADHHSPSFQCPHCPQTYQRRGDLTKHIHKVHGGQAPPQGDQTDVGRNDEEPIGPGTE